MLRLWRKIITRFYPWSRKLILCFPCLLIYYVYYISQTGNDNEVYANCGAGSSDFGNASAKIDSYHDFRLVFNKSIALCPCNHYVQNEKTFEFINGNNMSFVYKLLENYSDNFFKLNHSNSVEFGGFWQPYYCKSKHHVAIIIPYRDRKDHLRILLSHLHTVLQKQSIAYGIFVVEQSGNGTFNKGILMNSAFKWVHSIYNKFNCFIFHDVDLILENAKNLYICGDQPTHLSPSVSKLDYKLPYKELIGGVLAVRPEQYIKINGYSNTYWGWGGEDDDMYKRIKFSGMTVSRPPLDLGRYFMMPHEKRTWISHEKTYKLLGKSLWRVHQDGLNNVKYDRLSQHSYAYYTGITVSFNENSV